MVKGPCEKCGRSINLQQLTRHQKSKRCILIHMKKQIELKTEDNNIELKEPENIIMYKKLKNEIIKNNELFLKKISELEKQNKLMKEKLLKIQLYKY